MNLPLILVGTTGDAELTVDSSNTAIALGSGTVEVLGTPAMVALMEQAAVAALSDILPTVLTSVGLSLDISHLAATPPGMSCRATATVTHVEGRIVTFDVSASDGIDKIGGGTHQRAIVDVAKFTQRALAKSGNHKA